MALCTPQVHQNTRKLMANLSKRSVQLSPYSEKQKNEKQKNEKQKKMIKTCHILETTFHKQWDQYQTKPERREQGTQLKV